MKLLTEHIAYADSTMIPALTELWMDAFGDEREYVEFYFENRFTEENMLVYLEAGAPVSMLSLLPAFVHSGGKRLPARYVYAVATHKQYRKRGYAAALLQWGQEVTKEALLLEPAGKELAEYYRRLGFRDAFAVETCDLLQQTDHQSKAVRAAEWRSTQELSDRQQYWLLSVTPAGYTALRNRHFAGEGYVEWDEKAIAYALLENDFQGGFAFQVLHDGREDLLLYRMEGDRMNVIETTLSDRDVLGVAEKLLLCPASIQVRRPKSSGGEPFGMIRSSEYSGTDGYLNLTLE